MQIYRNLVRLFQDKELLQAAFPMLLEDLLLQPEELQIEAGAGFQQLLEANVLQIFT